MSHDQLLLDLADRVIERCVGIKKPAYVRSGQVSVNGEGRVSALLNVGDVVVEVSLRRRDP